MNITKTQTQAMLPIIVWEVAQPTDYSFDLYNNDPFSRM